MCNYEAGIGNYWKAYDFSHVYFDEGGMRDEQLNLYSMLCAALLEQSPKNEAEAFELFEKVFMTARAAIKRAY